MRRRLFEHRIANFQPIQDSYENDRRIYTVPGGARYASVTTRIGEAMDHSKLDEWRKRVGEEEANRVSERAKKRGTRFHAIAESYLRNRECFPPDATLPDILSFRDVREVLDERVGTVYGIECPLYSHTLRTAGRADVVAEFDGLPSIIDFKTSKNPKQESWILSYFLQATTYAAMFSELTNTIIPRIVVIIAVDHDLPQVFVKNGIDYYEQVLDVFCRKL